MKRNTLTVSCIAAVFFLGISVQAQSVQDTVTREKKIDEVVMIGYGTVRKSDLTGAVSTVSGDALKQIPVSNVAEALTGKIAGVQITTTEGSPDAEISLKVRGGGSITQDSSPLIIVDGFPVSGMSEVTPSDIETITVLKDASSTAIYGSRGAYGVVLITTKGAKGGKVTGTFNSFTGYKWIAKKIDVLKPYDYAKWQFENALLLNDVASYNEFFLPFNQIDQYKSYEALDWQDRIYGNIGVVHSNDFGVRGGNDKTSFNINLANYKDDGIMLGSGFNRDNVTVNLKNKPRNNVDLSVTFRYSNTDIRGGGANEQKEFSNTDARLRHSVGYSPIDIPALTTDDTDEAEAGYLVNPYVAVRDNDRRQNKKNYTVQGGLGWTIIKNLKFQSNVGMEFSRNNDYRYYGRSTYYARNNAPADLQGQPGMTYTNIERESFRIANTLNYDFKNILNDNHSLKLMIGQEYNNLKSNTFSTINFGFPKLFSFDDTINLTSEADFFSINNVYAPEDRMLSFFGRLNYDLQNKYLLTATLRADGSSKFLGDNIWGYFPSVALAWKINEENFLNDVSWIKLLKLRGSYGEAGNNAIPTGVNVQNFLSFNNNWINGVSSYWAADKILANPDLKWETTISQNIGLDYELFNGRISGNVEVYKNITKDLLIPFPTPGTGYDAQWRNMGETQNQGVETSLNIDAIKKENYSLNLGFNVSFNKNRINALGSGMEELLQSSNFASAVGYDYLVRVGLPLGAMYGYQNDGRYEVSDFDYATGSPVLKTGIANASSIVGAVKPGAMKLKDLNGDGIVNADDRTVIGNAAPKHTGGFTLNATAKNFDFSAGFNWSVGNDIYNANKIEFTTTTVSSPDGQFRNLSTTMADGIRWTNMDAAGNLVTDPDQLAALNAGTTLWSPFMPRYVFSDWAVEDGSFLRLNTLTLGYSLPESLVRSIRLTKFRVYASAYNVFVITNYTGMDPEVSTRRQTPMTPGVDYSGFPRSRQVVFGANVSF
ncbi:SusC/RagA family TonB-linked outer membrane protein [Kaistella rhinocerotis]|uniref:SusC/RagA family TonB-linked outer membrane protein n=1 Tax=Kaistella rhinocerotis TaxID=3026437 RepID=UPI00255678D0|nr:TonB-dependent receptor [Kaistella sp. Ran72]